MFDFLITNTTVCTGLLNKAKKADVGIQNGKIEVILEESSEGFGKLTAKQVIDGKDLILTPGFIDPHASTGFGYFFPNAADHKLFQGITTEIFGNCGTSPAPIGKHLMSTMNSLSEDIGFPFDWQSTTEYFNRIQNKLQFNIGTLVGHSTLRAGNMDDWNELKPHQLTAMKTALTTAMDEGALGLSTGLIYAPGCFAAMDEIIELVRIVAEKGGVYASHIRNERDKLEDAITEALTIGKQANIPVLISHLKAAERENWGKIPKVLQQIEAYNAENILQATVDVYPYTAVSTKLRAFVPKYILQDGIAAVAQKVQQPSVVADIAAWIRLKDYDLTQMLIISDEFEQYYGKTVAQIAAEQNLSLAETIAQILTKSTETWIVYHCIHQEDIDTAINWHKAMICTDSWSYPINAPKSIGQPHPRSYGAFTTYLERYVLQQKTLSWEEAIHKITYLPAQFFKLEKRGQVKEGFHADLVLLNPKTLKANATYLNPRQLSSGVEHLWVNGQLTIHQGKILDTYAGEVLKHRV
ncbi:MAG: amidohydrolase family protein [Chitinophagales bacterium]